MTNQIIKLLFLKIIVLTAIKGYILLAVIVPKHLLGLPEVLEEFGGAFVHVQGERDQEGFA